MSEFKPVLLTLPSLTPSLALEVLPHGLTLHRIFVQADGRTHDIVVGPEAPEGHLAQKYTNTIIGRYANRLPIGTYPIERNGVKGVFTPIANENPKVSLHGGPKGYDYVPWTLLTPSNPPTLFTPAELAHLSPAPASESESFAVFRLVSPSGDQGYPGKLIVEALIALLGPGQQQRKYRVPGVKQEEEEYDLGSIVLVYRARVEPENGNKVVTPINLTQHWGFNLDASLKDKPESLSVKDHLLTIKSDQIIERDALALATGKFLPTSGDPVHAHAAKPIRDGFPKDGYDDFYVFSPPTSPRTPTRIPLSSSPDLLEELLKPSNDPTKVQKPAESVVELSSPKSGLKLIFGTNQSGVMFYSNNFASPSTGSRKKIHGGSGEVGDGYAPGSAAFLEFHNPFPAFLDPKNKDGEDTLLTSDELYHNYVRLDVKFKEPVTAARA